METRPALTANEMDGNASWHSLRDGASSSGGSGGFGGSLLDMINPTNFTYSASARADEAVAGAPCLFKLPYENVNSSCCFAFLIRSEEDLAALCLELEMYDALHEAFEVNKRGTFFNESMKGVELGIKSWTVDEEDEDMVLL